MPTPEQNKEAMETLRQLSKTVDAMTPEERANRPSIDELKPDTKADSAFRAEETPVSAPQQDELGKGVRVIQNAGGDGMEDASTKEILRDLVQVAKAIQNELVRLGQD